MNRFQKIKNKTHNMKNCVKLEIKNNKEVVNLIISSKTDEDEQLIIDNYLSKNIYNYYNEIFEFACAHNNLLVVEYLLDVGIIENYAIKNIITKINKGIYPRNNNIIKILKNGFDS